MVVVGIVVSGLIVGALARLAVPGPDPMPVWKTILFGVGGSVLGGGVGYAVAGDGGGLVGAVLAATLLIVGYRRFVQHRPITGPRARQRR